MSSQQLELSISEFISIVAKRKFIELEQFVVFDEKRNKITGIIILKKKFVFWFLNKITSHNY